MTNGVHLPYKDKEKDKERKRRYYLENKEKKKEYSARPEVRERVRELDLRRRVERKLEAIELLGGKCQRCGGVYHPCQFDFHHTTPEEKDFDPCSALTRKREVFFAELKKCILLCANCHRLEHYKYETTISPRQRAPITATNSEGFT